MAVNRLRLTCARCLDSVPIARLQVGMESIWLPSRVALAEYEGWLDFHSRCGVERGELGLRVALTSENGNNVVLA